MTIADAEQVVVESDPYRRLSYTWHTFTPKWAQTLDLAEDARDAPGRRARSKVTFEIEPLGRAGQADGRSTTTSSPAA